MRSDEPIELVNPTAPFQSTADTRPRMPEPLPVKLVTIDHAHLPAAAGREVELDEFYVLLFGFQRIDTPEPLAYRAENFDLLVDILGHPPGRDMLPPLA